MVLRFKFPYVWMCQCGREHQIPLREIVIEEGCLLRLHEIVDDLDVGTKCLVVEDSTTRTIAGRRVKQILEKADYSVDEAVIQRADLENVRRVGTQLHGHDFCVAVGGGAPIDVAKITGYENKVPFVSVPTALSHDGIASPIASIIQNHRKASLQANPPVAVVADLEILLKAPGRMISAGYGDVMAKATSLKDWELGRDDKGEYYCERAARLALHAVTDLIESSRTRSKAEALRSLVEALLNCGVSMILAGSSRPASGSEHLFSHFLDMNAERTAMHGEQCGVGTILLARYHEEHNPNWWRQPEYRWQNIKRVLKDFGGSPSLGRFCISRDLAARALVEGSSIRPERHTIIHKRPPTLAEASTLIEETSVT